MSNLNPEVWGPHYWFVLHSVAFTFPLNPNEAIKKKYYEFIQNIPTFIPNRDIGNDFAKILEQYPVSPYLDSRESFVKWLHHIHNVVNKRLGKPTMSYDDALIAYYAHYRSGDLVSILNDKFQDKFTYLAFVSGLIALIYFLYNK